jgi:hypothetical protein
MTARRLTIVVLVVVVTLLAIWHVSLSNRLGRAERRAEENKAVAQRICLESNNLRDGLRGLGVLMDERIQYQNTGLSKEGLRNYFEVVFKPLDCDALRH